MNNTPEISSSLESEAQPRSSNKLLIAVLLTAIITALVVGFGIYCWQKNTNLLLQKHMEQLPVASPTDSHMVTPAISSIENIKPYRNEQYGYEIQYPAFFTVDDKRPDYVSLSNFTCESNDRLCFLGIDLITIGVSANEDQLSFDGLSTQFKNNNSTCQEISIFPLPENFNEDEQVKAIRCEFDEVPKQAKGGYEYTMIKNNNIFTVTMYQGDSTIVADINGTLDNITADKYDPLGDMMMRTFKWL